MSLADYRGDLQIHSTFSDGTQTLDDIVATGLARGFVYSAVTDHAYGLKVANGVSMARLAIQHAEIDRLNTRHAGRFRVIEGIEANILADGGIDMSRDERRRLEIVVAAPHSGLRSSGDAQHSSLPGYFRFDSSSALLTVGAGFKPAPGECRSRELIDRLLWP